jgi:hypothetical protein
MSTYEGEHTIFGFLSQANLTQNDVLQFHPFETGFYYVAQADFEFGILLFNLQSARITDMNYHT